MATERKATGHATRCTRIPACPQARVDAQHLGAFGPLMLEFGARVRVERAPRVCECQIKSIIRSNQRPPRTPPSASVYKCTVVQCLAVSAALRCAVEGRTRRCLVPPLPRGDRRILIHVDRALEMLHLWHHPVALTYARYPQRLRRAPQLPQLPPAALGC